MDKRKFQKELSRMPDTLTSEFLMKSVRKAAKEHQINGTYNIWRIMEEFVELIAEIVKGDIVGILEELADCYLSLAHLAVYYGSEFSYNLSMTWQPMNASDLILEITKIHHFISKLLLDDTTSDKELQTILSISSQVLINIKNRYQITDQILNHALYVKIERDFARLNM